MSLRAKAVTSAGTLLVLALAGGCGTERPGVPPPACVPNETILVERLSIEPVASGSNVQRGVDLDGATVAEEVDYAACTEQLDFEDPDGQLVDAELGALIDILGSVLEVDPAGILGGGPFNIAIERRGEGVCAGAWLSLNGGEPRLAEWNGSTYRAHDLGSIPLRLELPDTRAELTLHGVAARLTVTEGRVDSLVLAGRLDVDELLEALEPVDSVEVRLIQTTVEAIADLNPGPDGHCTQVSVSLVASL